MLSIFVSIIIIISGLFIALSYFLSRIIYNVGLNPNWDSDNDIEDRAKIIKFDDKFIIRGGIQ